MKSFADDLRGARVHIGGVGRIGTSVALALHEAGVGQISANDPQNFEEEQMRVCGFSRRSDLGRPKVHVLQRVFDGRANFTFKPIVLPNQSPSVKPDLERADVIVSCANRLDARLYLERMAVSLSKPIVQVCAEDGRNALGGIMSVWIPGSNHSCFGCLFPGRAPSSSRGEVLLPTVTRTLADIAASRVIAVLGGLNCYEVKQSNVFILDLKSYRLDALAIRPRRGCLTCYGSKSHQG